MKKILHVLFLVCILMLQACGESPSPTVAVDVPEPTAIASAAAVVTAGVVVPPTEATFIAAPPVTHVVIPSAGTSDRATAHDNENSLFFDTKKVKTGDEYFRNRFERPFTAVDMNYLPDLDIVNFSINSDENFFYVKISMVGLDASTQTLNGSYGIEIDRNADGRAELLLTTRPPYSTEFTADNVAAYLDLNSNVGGGVINRPDAFGDDGFEAIIFDLNKGIYPENDPDFLWVRQATDGELPAVEIAFARWMFKDNGKEAFMWSVISNANGLDPSKMNYHDHYTPEQAGAANTDDPNYPLKELSALDNTCRVPLGFQASGTELLGCYMKSGDVEEKATPVPDGPSSTCSIFAELCNRTKLTYQLYIPR